MGYGPNESDPRGNVEWTWYDATFSGQVGNNDEFVGTLLPEVVGEFDYVYRYSTNGAVSWVYAYENGPVQDPYDSSKVGDLTVNPSSDITDPSAPVLAVDDWSASSISLSWTESTDDVAVYAYDIYRSTDGLLFEKIGRNLAPVTTYTDMSVENLEMYYYFVVALDTSFNRGENSNIVEQMAEPKMVQVTFVLYPLDAWALHRGRTSRRRQLESRAVPMTKVNDALFYCDILDVHLSVQDHPRQLGTVMKARTEMNWPICRSPSTMALMALNCMSTRCSTGAIRSW